MSESAYQALKRALENRGKETTITVDGYTTFLFLKRDGTQKVGMDYNTIIRNLMKKYNKWHKESLPNITPHYPSAYVLYLYGKRRYESLGVAVHHGPCQNITLTLDYYTHVDACSVKAEMERLIA
jgi:hypothetical protein